MSPVRDEAPSTPTATSAPGGAGRLAGHRVIVTRAPHQAGPLLTALRARGAEPILTPAITIAPPRSLSDLDAALADLSHYDGLILTSGNAVSIAAERARALDLDLAACPASCVGPKTAAAWRAVGGRIARIANPAHAEALLAALRAEARAGQRWLLLQGQLADATLRAGLGAVGVDVRSVEAYRTVTAQENAAFRAAIGSASAALFTSGSTVTGCACAYESAAGFAEALRGRATVSIGPKTSAALRRLGVEEVYEARPHDLDGLLSALDAALAPALASEASKEGPHGL